MTGISIYDSTLRDGAQMVGINFSLQDKIKIVETLVNDLGVPFLEVYPFSNPKDHELIKHFQETSPKILNHLVPFGSTRKVSNKVENDPNLQSLVEFPVKAVTIFGKTWDFHLDFIHATPEQNLEMIEESIRYLKEHKLTVFYDAEHFFDGYKANKEYALKTLKAAVKGGADSLILCDTNGGALPGEVYDITEKIIDSFTIPLGIHAHNDSGLAVANSIACVDACLKHNRACQVQGTMNGLGERAGNANLTTLLPVLVVKMGLTGVIPLKKLENLTNVSHLISELSNQQPSLNAPFVGLNVFSHKGGMHIAAINHNSLAYEHINPEIVGNKRKIVMSEMAGRSALLHKCKKFGIQLRKSDPVVEDIMKVIKRKEAHGYTYEGADGSLYILIRSMMQMPEEGAAYYRRYFFEVDYFRVITDVRNVFKEENLTIFTDANIKTLVAKPDGFHEYHTAADGNGPVNAIDKALRKALIHFYPVLKEIELIDFKVRITNAGPEEHGTASRVRVLVETRDADGEIWGTIGVHVNIIVASFVALLDSYVYKLLKEDVPPYTKS